LLFAPEEGTQTRKKIKKKTNSLASELIDALEKSKQKAGETADDLKAKGEEYKNEFKDKAEEVKDAATDEFEKYN
jgi:gas vesicle protein